MVVVKRPRFGVLRYLEVYFARQDQLAALVRNLGPLEMLYGFSPSPLPCGGMQPLVQRQTKTTFIDLSKGLEAIWLELHANCRYEVRRAERIVDRFEIAMNTAAARADFRQLYNRFARVKGHLPQLSAGRFNHYLPYADVFTLYFEGRPTCGRLVLREQENGAALILYSATRRLEPGADTVTIGWLNRYLHWYELQRYQAAGMKRYDFGGAGDAYPSVTRFKCSFGGELGMLHYSAFAGTAIVWKLLHSLRRLPAQRRLGMKHATV